MNGPFGSDLLTSELTDSGVVVVYVQDIKGTDTVEFRMRMLPRRKQMNFLCVM